MKYISMFICLFSAISTFAAAEVSEYPSSSIKAVEIFNASGLVRAVGSSESKAVLSIDKVKNGDQCEVKIENKNSTLRVHVEQKALSSKSCQINISAQIPKTATITIRNGAGNIAIEEVTGGLSYAVGSGDVNIKGNPSKLEGSSGSGDTKFEGNTASIQLKSGSGDIDLTYSEVPKKGDLDVKTGSGDTTISLPEGTKLSAETATGTGSIVNELNSQKDAPFKVSVKSGTGDLSIRKF